LSATDSFVLPQLNQLLFGGVVDLSCGTGVPSTVAGGTGTDAGAVGGCGAAGNTAEERGTPIVDGIDGSGGCGICGGWDG